MSANMAYSAPNAPEKQADVTITTRSGLSCWLDIARVSTKRVTHIEIAGEKERARGDWTTGTIQIFDREKLIFEETVPSTSTIVLMLKDFFEALRTNRPVPITGEDGLRAVELAEACYQAAKSQQPVHWS